MAKILAVLLLLFPIACGTPAPPSTPGGPPPPNLPQMDGTWAGSMVFTNVTGSLTFNLAEDAYGNLTGDAVSTPPHCEFTLAVSGKVYTNGQFFLQTSDNTTASFAGTLSSGNKTVSGNVGLGNGTGCGPRNGTFAAQGG